MGDSAIEYVDRDLDDVDDDRCHHGVLFCDECPRCEDEEWDAETAEMLDDEDGDG